MDIILVLHSWLHDSLHVITMIHCTLSMIIASLFTWSHSGGNTASYAETLHVITMIYCTLSMIIAALFTMWSHSDGNTTAAEQDHSIAAHSAGWANHSKPPLSFTDSGTISWPMNSQNRGGSHHLFLARSRCQPCLQGSTRLLCLACGVGSFLCRLPSRASPRQACPVSMILAWHTVEAGWGPAHTAGVFLPFCTNLQQRHRLLGSHNPPGWKWAHTSSCI